MKPNHICVNHPDEEAHTFCRHCHDWICPQCVVEGAEHYYCQKPECLKNFNKEEAHLKSICPYCGNKVDLDPPFCNSCGKQIRELTTKEKNEDLVTLAVFTTTIDAQLARTKLESEHIEAYVQDEQMLTIFAQNIALGGVRLQIKKSDCDRAKQILEESLD